MRLSTSKTASIMMMIIGICCPASPETFSCRLARGLKYAKPAGPLAQSTFTPRRIRAIPHNAILQQMAIPTNVIFGIGPRWVALTRTASMLFFVTSRVGARLWIWCWAVGAQRTCRYWARLANFRIRIFGFRAQLPKETKIPDGVTGLSRTNFIGAMRGISFVNYCIGLPR